MNGNSIVLVLHLSKMSIKNVMNIEWSSFSFSIIFFLIYLSILFPFCVWGITTFIVVEMAWSFL